MKAKPILFIGVVAVLTLSFSFTQVNSSKEKVLESTQTISASAPVGGFAEVEITK